jgi:nicotinate-nucleotide--dimethylbenzimidazole phosphoribosyltransferase
MNFQEQLQHKINTKTKPIGALGVLEEIALQIGSIQNTINPEIKKPHIVVFAGDHGVAATGKVNPYPQSVTAQMVLNFVNGGAAINVFCKQNNIGLTVVDAGVNFDFDQSLPIKHCKVGKSTVDYTQSYAMASHQVNECLQKGAVIVEEIFNTGCNTIAFGEMGIGNTSSAALIMHHYTGLPLEECVGRGTGANDAQLQEKLNTLYDAAAYHELSSYDITPNRIMESIGGYEIVMMAGAYIKAYELGMIIVVDGFIATAALYLAIKEYNQPKEQQVSIGGDSVLLHNCIFAHTSGEQGHLKMLAQIGAKPLLHLGMRLGEGTGAALAIPLMQNGCAFVNQMASFETAGVSEVISI